jgi:arylsulfatase A-like enzyme
MMRLLFILLELGTTLQAARPNVLILLADDLGYADLGCQDSPDVKTPRIDSLAQNGVRCTAGYVTAPQCSPSRAGLLSGRYQQRFGHEGNPNFPIMLMHGGKTIADHLKAAGYATGQFGKWHLGFESAEEAPKEIRETKDQMLPTQHGFDESFGYADYAKAAKEGGDIAPAPHHAYDDRVFARKASDFIARHPAQPWFIYLALHAPHTQQVDFGGYRARFPEADKKRANVLSVMAQQNEAVGTVLDELKARHLEENTLIVYLSDNGGTLRSEGERKHFTGSLNTPFSGDKGTVLEGGIREPFLLQWKGHLPTGKTYDRPVSSLDLLPTALAAAGITPPTDLALDGVNLLPFLDGTSTADPHEALFWRWRAEQAVRMGDWKLVRGKEHRAWRLIDLAHDVKEEHDLTEQHPDKAKALLARFEQWNATLLPPGPSFKDTTEADDDGATPSKKPK